MISLASPGKEPLKTDTKIAEAQPETIAENVDEIALKQTEMRDTIVLVTTRSGSGSGTVIDKTETENSGIYEYRVLTNAHVTYSRFIRLLKGVDSITGKLDIRTIDTGCAVVVFDYANHKWKTIDAKVVSEDNSYDLSMLTFVSKDEVPVARVADKSMLSKVRVFDEVFAIGCQLGKSPTPTNGIISQIIKGKNGKKEWVVYGTTSQITPGSSGGGLFKKYNGHYYIIGIPYRIALASNGQMIPHLARAISITTAEDFINRTMVTHP